MHNGKKTLLALLVSVGLVGCGGDDAGEVPEAISIINAHDNSTVIDESFDDDCQVVAVSGSGEYNINSEDQCVVLTGSGSTTVFDKAKHTSKIFVRINGVSTIFYRGGVVDLSRSSGVVRAINTINPNGDQVIINGDDETVHIDDGDNDCKIVNLNGVGAINSYNPNTVNINSEDQCILLTGGGSGKVIDTAEHTSKIFSNTRGAFTIYHQGGVVDLSNVVGVVKSIDTITGKIVNKISSDTNKSSMPDTEHTKVPEMKNVDMYIYSGVGHIDSSKGPVYVSAGSDVKVYDDAKTSGDIFISAFNNDTTGGVLYHHGGKVSIVGDNQNIKIVDLDNGDTDSAMDCFNPGMFGSNGSSRSFSFEATDIEKDEYANHYSYSLAYHNGNALMTWTMPDGGNRANQVSEYKLSPMKSDGTLSYSEVNSGFNFEIQNVTKMLYKEVFNKNIPLYNFNLLPNQTVTVKSNVSAHDYEGNKSHYKTIRKLTFVGHEKISIGGIEYQTCHFHNQTNGTYFGQADKDDVMSMDKDKVNMDQWITRNTGVVVRMAVSGTGIIGHNVVSANVAAVANGQKIS